MRVNILGTFLCRPLQNNNVKWLKFFVVQRTWNTEAIIFFFLIFIANLSSCPRFSLVIVLTLRNKGKLPRDFLKSFFNRRCPRRYPGFLNSILSLFRGMGKLLSWNDVVSTHHVRIFKVFKAPPPLRSIKKYYLSCIALLIFPKRILVSFTFQAIKNFMLISITYLRFGRFWKFCGNFGVYLGINSFFHRINEIYRDRKLNFEELVLFFLLIPLKNS